MDQGKIIRFCVVALPAGLLLIGAASVYLTHLAEGRDPELVAAERKRQEAAAILRRPIDRADLEKYVRTLATDIGERHLGEPVTLRTAAFWIESTLGPNNLGYTVEREKYQVGGEDVWNVVAELPGGRLADQIVVVGAHYDTVPDCPGANDNGTGVAALISLAGAFSGTVPDRTIRFVAFANEEPPYFRTDDMGSRVHAARLKQAGARVTAMLSLETIGFYSSAPQSQKSPTSLPAGSGQFPGVGDFVALVGNPETKPLIDTARAAWEKAGLGVKSLPVILPESIDGVDWSDHASFWRAGYPALMITDTAPYRYPHYHLPTDTPDKIDFERFTEAVKGIKAVVERLASEP
jgi:hypothetical protein